MIYSSRPFNTSQVCTKIIIGEYKVSIAMDDSMRAMHRRQQTEIVVFQNDEVVTHRFWPKDEIANTAEHLIIILNRVQALQEKG